MFMKLLIVPMVLSARLFRKVSRDLFTFALAFVSCLIPLMAVITESRTAAVSIDLEMTLPWLKPRGFFPVSDRIRNLGLAPPAGGDRLRGLR